MDAKEKAKELYDKFEKIFIDANADSWGKEAKHCALIAVDEKEKTILECIGTDREVWGRDEFILFNELQQIKEEIEKIIT